LGVCLGGLRGGEGGVEDGIGKREGGRVERGIHPPTHPPYHPTHHQKPLPPLPHQPHLQPPRIPSKHTPIPPLPQRVRYYGCVVVLALGLVRLVGVWGKDGRRLGGWVDIKGDGGCGYEGAGRTAVHRQERGDL